MATGSRLPQGSLELLETPLARSLLTSAIPARLADVAADGTPRLVASWFQWSDGELVMLDQPGTRMARISVRPQWVGLLDFAGDRLPAVMAGAPEGDK